MINTNNYFKGEKEMALFTLLYVGRKERYEILGADYSCFSDKIKAEKWFNHYKELVQDNKKALEKLTDMYEEMIY